MDWENRVGSKFRAHLGDHCVRPTTGPDPTCNDPQTEPFLSCRLSLLQSFLQIEKEVYWWGTIIVLLPKWCRAGKRWWTFQCVEKIVVKSGVPKRSELSWYWNVLASYSLLLVVSIRVLIGHQYARSGQVADKKIKWQSMVKHEKMDRMSLSIL